MKDVILEVATPQIEKDLISLGKKCDIDLNHIPFSNFTIKIFEDKNFKKDIINKTIDIQLKRTIGDIELDPTKEAKLREEMASLIEDKLLESDINLINRQIDIDIKDNTVLIDYKNISKFKFVFNKMVFNVDDELDVSLYILEKYKELSEEEIYQFSSNAIFLIFGMITFMTMTKENIKPTKKIINNTNKNKKKNKKKNKSNKKKYIYNYKIDYDFLNSNSIVRSNSNNIKGNKRAYHLDSWYRRGHWRSYKSGKKVWIDQQFVYAHNKAVDDNDNDNNIYRITKMK